MHMLRAAHYDETVEALIADPIIIAMAAEIPADFDGRLNDLMVAALHGYTERGGQVNCHIGGPIEAIAILRPDLQEVQA
jgi:hypothetical protein